MAGGLLGPVLAIVGTIIGTAIGGPIGGAIGSAIGSTLGNAIDPIIVDGPKLGDASSQTSRDGVPIPIGWGIFHVVGNIIQTNESYIIKVKSGNKKEGFVVNERRLQTFAIGIARGPTGPIPGIRRVWENNKLIYDTTPLDDIAAGKHGSYLDLTERATMNAAFEASTNLYLGDETQLPDPFLEAETGVGLTPAYRGLGYCVFKDKDITDFASAIPTYRWEIAPSCEEVVEYRYLVMNNNTKLTYVRLNVVNGGHDVLGELTIDNTGNPGIGCDGKYIVVPAPAAGPNMEVYTWDGADLQLDGLFTNLDYNAFFYMRAFDGGKWYCAGSGPFNQGLSYGTFSNGNVGTASYSTWDNDLSNHILDFRAPAKSTGYGDGVYVACNYEVSSQVIVTFSASGTTIDYPGYSGPGYLGRWNGLHSGDWGWDRDTGDFCCRGTWQAGEPGYPGSYIRWWEVNTTTGIFKGDPKIIDFGGTVLTAFTWHKGYLIGIAQDGGPDPLLTSYSISGTTATVHDTIDISTYWAGTYSPPNNVQRDPYSNLLLFCKDGSGAVGVYINDNGTFDTDVLQFDNGSPTTTSWGQDMSNVHWLDGPLEIT